MCNITTLLNLCVMIQLTSIHLPIVIQTFEGVGISALKMEVASRFVFHFILVISKVHVVETINLHFNYSILHDMYLSCSLIQLLSFLLFIV